MTKVLVLLSLTISLFAGMNKSLSNKELQQNYSIGDNKAGIILAKRYYKNKELDKASKIFFDLSLTGEKDSYSFMGEFLAKGIGGLRKDCQKASMFLFSGLKENDCRSNKIISDLYNNGICVKKNISKKEKYLNRYNKCKNKEVK